MPLKSGDRVGAYEVSAKIGEGGMGEVYQARDTTLDRDVALKVMPEAFTSDPDRLARFEREAKVLASLNHPNIGHIYGLEQSGDTRALVLELVEGPTLADRIGQGPVPIDEALPIATQITEALEAAHASGVIHRDLKPANVKLRPDGTVKVLDFGLAKAVQPEASDVSVSLSPTVSLTAAATQMGMVIGTAAYMAPEQASGKPVDARADIFAFGAVLFEMVTGTRPFVGDDVSKTLAHVIAVDPDWSALPADLPPLVERFLRGCLEKDPRQRVQAIGDVRLALGGAFDVAAPAVVEPSEAAVPTRVWQRPVPALAVVVAAVALGGLAVWGLTGPVVESPDLMRFVIRPPAGAPLDFGGPLHNLAVSPDGSSIAYVGPAETAPAQINLRSLEQVGGSPLRGGEGGMGPFFSPDGEWVGFLHYQGGTSVRKVQVVGGPPITLTEAPYSVVGATWGSDDRIVFGTSGAGLFRGAGGGGDAEVLTSISGSESGHYWPSIIRGSGALVFVIGEGSPLETGQLAVLDLATAEITRLGLAGTSPRYVPTGHLVYAAADATLRAVPFDVRSLALAGNAVPLVDGLAMGRASSTGIGPWAMRSASVGPSTSSSTSAFTPPCPEPVEGESSSP